MSRVVVFPRGEILSFQLMFKSNLLFLQIFQEFHLWYKNCILGMDGMGRQSACIRIFGGGAGPTHVSGLHACLTLICIYGNLSGLIQTDLAIWNIAQLQNCTEAEFLDVL
jgi:hypothetical protein